MLLQFKDRPTTGADYSNLRDEQIRCGDDAADVSVVMLSMTVLETVVTLQWWRLWRRLSLIIVASSNDSIFDVCLFVLRSPAAALS